MKLSTKSVIQLEAILQTAVIGGIDALIFEDGAARGMNADKSFAMIANDNIPELPQKMGLSKISSLLSRMALFKSDMNIDVKESERGEISVIEISSGKNKVQFRCTSTILIKAPKSINDTLGCKVMLTKQESKTLLDAIRVMGAKTASLTIMKNGTTRFNLLDDSHNDFTLVLEQESVREDTVVFPYKTDVLVSLIRNKSDLDEIVLDIGEMGTIKTDINGYSVTVIPEISEDSDD